MRVLSLFAGIGGFDLAAHWMGWATAAFVEWEDFPRQVLQKNFRCVPVEQLRAAELTAIINQWRAWVPGLPLPTSVLYGDICQFDARQWLGAIDLVCGGFPCQPFSAAGKQLGTADPRALWPQMCRVIRECAPRLVVGENVRGLLGNAGGLAFEGVCADLEAEGYDVLPLLLPAVGVGAPHKRDRFWFVAHAHLHAGHADTGTSSKADSFSSQHWSQYLCAGQSDRAASRCEPRPAANANNRQCQRQEREVCAGRNAAGLCGEASSHPDSQRLAAGRCTCGGQCERLLLPHKSDCQWQADGGTTERHCPPAANPVCCRLAAGGQLRAGQPDAGGRGETTADADGERQQECQYPGVPAQPGWTGGQYSTGRTTADTACKLPYGSGREGHGRPESTNGHWRLTESPLCGPDDGLPARLVRTASPRAKQLKAYGNAIVPQVAYQIFKAVAAVEALANG